LGRVRRPAVPVVLRPEGPGETGDVAWQRRALAGSYIRRRCRTADAFVAISERIRNELVEAGYPPERIYLIPNGVELPQRCAGDGPERSEVRAEYGLGPDRPLVLFLGRLSPEKGLEVLLDAWTRVKRDVPAAALLIVGSGPAAKRLKRRAAELSDVLFAGQRPDPERFLLAADLFVLPSLEEGLSIALLEAMAYGLPVVATDIAGNREVIEPGRHGLLVRPGRPEALAEAIAVQLKARTIAAGMARAARERVAAEYSIERMAERHVLLFETLIGAKRGAGRGGGSAGT